MGLIDRLSDTSCADSYINSEEELEIYKGSDRLQ